MTALDARSAAPLRSCGLRWLPTGLLIPVIVLLALSRGLSLTEIRILFGLQVSSCCSWNSRRAG
jgi:hypothetical protein